MIFARNICIVLLFVTVAGCKSLGPARGPDGNRSAPLYDIPTEIDTAATLPFERDRRERLYLLAQAEDLTESAQLRLIEATLRALADDEDRERVFVALIESPAFTEAAHGRLVRRMNAVNSPATRLQLFQSLNRKAMERQWDTEPAPPDDK